MVNHGRSLGWKIKPELKTQCRRKKEQTCQGYDFLWIVYFDGHTQSALWLVWLLLPRQCSRSTTKERKKEIIQAFEKKLVAEDKDFIVPPHRKWNCMRIFCEACLIGKLPGRENRTVVMDTEDPGY